MARNKTPYKVEVYTRGPGGGQWFDTIAAFDCEPAATNYAVESSKSNPKTVYRIKRQAGGLVELVDGKFRYYFTGETNDTDSET